MAVGLLGHWQRTRIFPTSGSRDIAREAAEEVEHALAPGAQRVFRAEHLVRTHDARPLEDREQDVVAVSRLAPADVRLALERRLHRLERAAQAPQRLVALGARLLQGLLHDLLHHVAEAAIIARIDPLVDVGDDDRQHRGYHGPVHPGIQGLRYAAADGAAEQRRRLRVAVLQVLGDLPGIAHHGLIILDDLHGLAAGEGDGRLV